MCARTRSHAAIAKRHAERSCSHVGIEPRKKRRAENVNVLASSRHVPGERQLHAVHVTQARMAAERPGLACARHSEAVPTKTAKSG